MQISHTCPTLHVVVVVGSNTGVYVISPTRGRLGSFLHRIFPVYDGMACAQGCSSMLNLHTSYSSCSIYRRVHTYVNRQIYESRCVIIKSRFAYLQSPVACEHCTKEGLATRFLKCSKSVSSLEFCLLTYPPSSESVAP